MDHLPVYLNDHLAGSVAALELLDRLTETYQGDPLGDFFSALRIEIEADQAVLKELLQVLGEEESTMRKAGAWIVEKISRSKIHLDPSNEGEMGLFLALEGLVLGITGKEALWHALAVASASIPTLAGLDYPALIQRAVAQREMVETKRLELAGAVFRPVAATSKG